MPCDYSKYPANWHTEIRPSILERANDCCEECYIQNGSFVIRGVYNGIPCVQTEDGYIYREDCTHYTIGEDYLGEVHPTNRMIKIVLTIAHLDHDTTNNDPSNLKALCQLHHNRHDKEYRNANRKATIKKKKGILELDLFAH